MTTDQPSEDFVRQPSRHGKFQEKKDVAEVAAAVRSDRSLSEPLRHAALRAVLRRPAMRGEAKAHGDHGVTN